MPQINMSSCNSSQFIPWAKPILFGNEKKYVLDALDSTWISGGEYVNRFEKCISKHFGAKFGVAVSSGTTALQLALLGLDIGPGDEVIVPGFTFVGPVNMVIAVGAEPVYADVDAKTWSIGVESIKDCLTPRTKAIMAVHLYGNVCEMQKIMELTRSKNLYLIEDTAESAFSKYKGEYAGTFGNVGCLSFQATKTITTGEGGMVLTDNEQLYHRMQLIRDHGMRKDKRYWHDVIGYNFRITNFQAALGCAQFEKLNIILRERERVYRTYCRRLDSVSGIEMQYFSPEIQPVVWTVGIKLNSKKFRGKRDKVIKKMLEANIETRPGFYALSLLAPYRSPHLSAATEVSENVICLPAYPLLTDEKIKYICDKFSEILTELDEI